VRAYATSKFACVRENQNFTISAFVVMLRAAISATRTRSAIGGFIKVCQCLIVEARRLYVSDAFGVDLDNTVYALDTNTIDLSLKAFPWAHFRKAKAAVKMHTQIDLRGNIPSFIHVSDGKMHEVNALDLLTPEPGSFTIMDRGFLDFARLYRLTQAGAFFVIRPKSYTLFKRVYSQPVDRSTGLRCDQTVRLTDVKSPEDYPRRLSTI
jgi:hypothetical protein